jgi:hypothetical protein
MHQGWTRPCLSGKGSPWVGAAPKRVGTHGNGKGRRLNPPCAPGLCTAGEAAGGAKGGHAPPPVCVQFSCLVPHNCARPSQLHPPDLRAGKPGGGMGMCMVPTPHSRGFQFARRGRGQSGCPTEMGHRFLHTPFVSGMRRVEAHGVAQGRGHTRPWCLCCPPWRVGGRGPPGSCVAFGLRGLHSRSPFVRAWKQGERGAFPSPCEPRFHGTPACKWREGATQQPGVCSPPTPGVHPVLHFQGGQGTEMGAAPSLHPVCWLRRGQKGGGVISYVAVHPRALFHLCT